MNEAQEPVNGIRNSPREKGVRSLKITISVGGADLKSYLGEWEPIPTALLPLLSLSPHPIVLCIIEFLHCSIHHLPSPLQSNALCFECQTTPDGDGSSDTMDVVQQP